MDGPPFFSFPPVSFNITNEEFNSFHSMDRKLYFSLIHKLNRNVFESMHVGAFLIWLEREGYSHNAVLKLLDWPLHLVNQVYDEIVSCLSCLEEENFSNKWRVDFYLLPKLCSRHVSLYKFHQIRFRVTSGVSKIMAKICFRAFKDILQQKLIGLADVVPVHASVGGGFPHMGFGGNILNSQQNMSNQILNPLGDPNTDLSIYFGGMNIVNGCEDEPDVPEDDRTIFLTFSKGYYIAASEIKDFFTSIFGDFIEAIHMQEVSPDEQPLYAKMVARSSSIIPAIAPSGESKAKYSINGKHIWAKKYVKKNRSRSSPPPGASSSWSSSSCWENLENQA